jgi:hypothetical protein
VRERQLAFLHGGFDGIELRYESYIAVIAHPDRGLMGANESGYRLVVEVVGCDADLVLASLRRPVRHREWWRNERHGSAIPDLTLRGSNQGIDVADGVSIRRVSELDEKRPKQAGGNERTHRHQYREDVCGADSYTV